MSGFAIAPAPQQDEEEDDDDGPNFFEELEQDEQRNHASVLDAQKRDPKRFAHLNAVAGKLFQHMDGAGTDEDELFRELLGVGGPEDQALLRAIYEDHYHRSLDSEMRSELTEGDNERAQKLLAGDAETTHELVSDIVEDGEAEEVEAMLSIIDPGRLKSVDAGYEGAGDDGSLMEHIGDEIGDDEDRAVIEAMARGDGDGAAIARARRALDDGEVEQATDFAAEASPMARMASPLGAELILAGIDDGDETTMAAAIAVGSGGDGTVLRAQDALADEDMERLVTLTEGMDGKQVGEFKSTPGWDEIVEDEAGGEEEFDIRMSLRGPPKTREEAIKNSLDKWSFERGSGKGLFGGIVDAGYEAPEMLDEQAGHLLGLQAQLAFADPERKKALEAEIDTRVGYTEQDLANYRVAEDDIAEGATFILDLIAKIGLTAVGCPAWLAAGIGSAAGSAGKQLVVGDSMNGNDRERAGVDALKAAATTAGGEALGGALGGPLEGGPFEFLVKSASEQAVSVAGDGAVSLARDEEFDVLDHMRGAYASIAGDTFGGALGLGDMAKQTSGAAKAGLRMANTVAKGTMEGAISGDLDPVALAGKVALGQVGGHAEDKKEAKELAEEAELQRRATEFTTPQAGDETIMGMYED